MKAQVYTVDGRTAALPVLCRIFHIEENTVRHRITRGWSIEDALKTPPRVFRMKENGKPTPCRKKKTPAPTPKREVVWIQTGSAAGYYDWK